MLYPSAPDTNAAGIEQSATKFQDTPLVTAPYYFCNYSYGEDPGSNALGLSNVVPTSATAGVVYTFGESFQLVSRISLAADWAEKQ